MKLPCDFLDRMRTQLGEDGYAAYLAAMERAPQRALRVNTLKTDVATFLARMPLVLTPCSTLPESFFVPEDFQPGRSLLHRAGHFYMQEPSAQLPVSAMPLSDGMTVLDLCAAPGGKATQIAAALHNSGLLIANEPVAGRAKTLLGNLERLGVTNTAVTCMQPDRLCTLLTGCFDAVLVDAPCSGEGMFRKEEQAVRDWSSAHVRSCAARQKAILDAAACALRAGGALVYSTCTFAPEENERQIEEFLHTHGDFSIARMQHVYPQDGCGEGQFFALLHKAGQAPHGMLPVTCKPVPLWEEFCLEYMPVLPPQRAKLLPDGRVFLLPALCTPGYERLHILSAGVCAGEVKNGRFFPAHALAMAYPDAFGRRVELDDRSLAAYLRGETVRCDPALSGWCAVSGEGLVCGLGKAVGGTLKNHLPKGLRG